MKTKKLNFIELQKIEGGNLFTGYICDAIFFAYLDGSISGDNFVDFSDWWGC